MPVRSGRQVRSGVIESVKARLDPERCALSVCYVPRVIRSVDSIICFAAVAGSPGAPVPWQLMC